MAEETFSGFFDCALIPRRSTRAPLRMTALKQPHRQECLHPKARKIGAFRGPGVCAA